MTTSTKIWTTLGLATALSATNITATATSTHEHKKPIQLAQAASAEGATEGEGGEAEGSLSDAAYIAKLGYVLGHMRVGTALYAKNEIAMSKTHMKHPRDEIYANLEPTLKERKSVGFANELDALANAVEANAAAADVETKFKALETQILKNLPQNISASVYASAVALMVHEAGEEYFIGVKNGNVTELHEYQDAFGFVETAKFYIASLPAAEREEHKTQVEEIEKELNALSAQWPDIVGKSAIATNANPIFAAAARIELQALAM